MTNATLVQTITNLYTSAPKVAVTNNSITYNAAPSVGLMNDRLGGTTTSLDGENIRYYAANPDNYIYFNCDDYSNQSEETCEVWRIIGVFDGKVKLIRGESIGDYSWDNKDTKTCNFTNIGIKENTRNLISEVTWNLGGNDNNSIYSNQYYAIERGTTVYSGRPTTWTGKISLAYPAELGSNKCNVNLYNYNNSNCIGSNWMYPLMTNNSTNNGWLLTPSSSNAYSARLVLSSGLVNNLFAYFGRVVVPVLYLNAEQSIKSGNGSSANPYRLQVSY